MNEKISCREEYLQALSLMDQLVDDYDTNRLLIERLSIAIERWEVQAEEFAEFNRAVRAVSGEPEP